MGNQGFPNITRTVAVEGYDLALTLVVNLSGADFEALISDDWARLGPALVRAYDGAVYDGGLDFSTPEAARATIERDDLPMDLRYFLRNAPIEAIDVYLEGLRGNFRRCFEGTKS